MVFSSLIFLFLFLPITLLFYFFSPIKLKNFILLAFSLLFYAWGEPQYVFLMIFSIGTNYFFGLWIDREKISLTSKKLFLSLAIVLNLLILGYYKYVNFLIENLNKLFHSDIPFQDLFLPIGISFYTFQAISYLIDVYRKDTPAQRNILNLALYISLFPQLVAGPIVRYKELNIQLKERTHSVDGFYEGVKLFSYGLAKKIIIANPMGELADTVFSQNTADLTTPIAWVGILAYSLQIYFDFSGYSDMALGLGRMFGFRFPKNFDYPYISKSVSEFWRRWHISLGNWFRDYVYISLGGNRVSHFKVYRNLFVVWFLTGLWHGASWNFIVWGLFYGILIASEKAFLSGWLKKIPRFFQHAYVILAFVIGWVFFRSEDLTQSFLYLKAMFNFSFTNSLNELEFYFFQFGIEFLLGILISVPLYKKNSANSQGILVRYIEPFFVILLFFLCIVSLMTSSYNPFIYFRF